MIFNKFMISRDSGKDQKEIFAARLLTAFLQAAALYLLTEAEALPKTWPATDPELFRPLFLAAGYVPLIILLGLGQIPGKWLAVWAAITAILAGGAGYHEVARAAVPAGAFIAFPWVSAFPVGLFIANVLVTDSIIEKRFFPSYRRHFDTAWKQGVQAVLALIFVGVFWGVLYLGAELFSLIGLGFFRRLIGHNWFAIPATALASAVSIHVSDVQPSLIRGARTLSLSLFSWLLPLLAIILLGFLASLPFNSLIPLWRTHFAAKLLLSTAIALIFLINSCYQDCAAEQSKSRVKRLAVIIGAIELVPLVGLAAWAVGLRAGQYGWSAERILAAYMIIVIICYAIGYTAAAIGMAGWMKRLEITNFVTAYVILAILTAALSPVGDPARLAVASQIVRLQSGAVTPDKFDFAALKFDGARWGAAALAKLSNETGGPEAATIRTKALQASAMTSRVYSVAPPEAASTPQELADRITVYPLGRTLPAAFVEASFAGTGPNHNRSCFSKAAQEKCAARFVRLQPGKPEAIIFIDRYSALVFEQDVAGGWRKTGQLDGPLFCTQIRGRLVSGDFTLAPHDPPDLVIGGRRLDIQPPPVSCADLKQPD